MYYGGSADSQSQWGWDTNTIGKSPITLSQHRLFRFMFQCFKTKASQYPGKEETISTKETQ